MLRSLALLLAVLSSSGLSPAQDEPEDTKPEPSPGSSAPKSPAGVKLETARGYLKSRHYEDAFKALKEAQALKPEASLAAEILQQTGSAYFAQGQDSLEEKISGVDARASLGEARKLFEEVLKTYPKEEKAASAAYMIGSCYLLLDDLEKAIQSYQRAYDGFPQSKERPRALLRVGVCQAGLDQPRKAYDTFVRLRQQFPDAKFDVKKASKYLEELSLVGRPAPPLKPSSWLLGLVGDDGIKTFEGQVVVVVFFATWCHFCKGNLSRLRGLIADWSPKGVVFLGVANPTDPMNTEQVDVYVQKNRLDYLDVALDKTGASWVAYNVDGLPAAAVIDRQGKVRWRGNLAFLPAVMLQRLTGDP